MTDRPRFSVRRFGNGYDRAEVDAFLDRLLAGAPITPEQIAATTFRTVLGDGYAVEEVRSFLSQTAITRHAATQPHNRPHDPNSQWPQSGERPQDRATQRPQDQSNQRPQDRAAQRPQDLGNQRPQDLSSQRPRFGVVRFKEGYDMGEVDDFLDRLFATLEGRPVGQPVTASDVKAVMFTPVRMREGYEVEDVDRFLDLAVTWLA